MEASAAIPIPGEGLVEKFRADELNVYLYASRAEMGLAAAASVAAEIRRLIEEKGHAIALFASAPSQNEFLAALASAQDIDWARVTGFHLDEYLGMSEDAPQSFRRFLIERLTSLVPMGEFHGLKGESPESEAACAEYAALMAANPPDFAVLGIGENGHLAFIDPPFCDFNDPAVVKRVELDEVCRNQQVNDGAFASLDEVPRYALSLTIPAIMSRPRLFAIVPGPAKRQAIKSTIEGPVETSCPASILRRHADAHLFIDRDSAALLSR